MSCSHCAPENTTVQFVNERNESFLITAFAADGDAVSFGATDQDGLDIKYDSLGNILTAGSRIKKITATIRTTCEAASDLWAAYKVNNFSDCGTTTITDNCCTDERFNTSRIVSVKRPNIGDSVDYFEIEIMGVFQ